MLTALAEGRPFDVDAAEDSDDELPGEEEAAASPAAAATGQEQDSPDATASQPPQVSAHAKVWMSAKDLKPTRSVGSGQREIKMSQNDDG